MRSTLNAKYNALRSENSRNMPSRTTKDPCHSCSSWKYKPRGKFFRQKFTNFSIFLTNELLGLWDFEGLKMRDMGFRLKNCPVCWYRSCRSLTESSYNCPWPTNRRVTMICYVFTTLGIFEYNDGWCADGKRTEGVQWDVQMQTDTGWVENRVPTKYSIFNPHGAHLSRRTAQK